MSARSPSRGLGFHGVILVGGLLFGAGLAASHVVRPEIVLAMLQFQDFGLVLVFAGALLVVIPTFYLAPRVLGAAPLTGDIYGLRVRSFDNDVMTGGVLFGVGWGLSGICPGAAYAAVGAGIYPVTIAIAGMFIGAYIQGYYRVLRGDYADTPATHTATSD